MNETEGNVTDVLPVWADDLHPPKTAFIVGAIFLFLVGPIICWYTKIFITNSLSKVERRGLINGVSKDDIDDTICREVMSRMAASTILSTSFLILGSVQMNFEITFIVIVSLACFYGLVISVCGAWQASSHFTCPNDENGCNTVEVDNRFQDFGNSFTGTFLLGCTQITLICVYILAVFEGGRPEFKERRIYIFYCLGSVIQIGYIVGKDLVRQLIFINSKGHAFWARMLNNSRENGITYDWKYRWDNKLTQHEIWLRMLFSILVNQVGMQLLLALLPLQLASSTNPFDFVLNAVAAYFVIEMDDIETKVYDRFHSADDEETNGEEVGLIRSGAEAIAEYNVKAGLGFEPIYGSSLYVE